VLIERVFLLRKEIKDFLDLCVFLRVDDAVVIDRARTRDVPGQGIEVLDRYRHKYLPAQREYLRNHPPRRSRKCDRGQHLLAAAGCPSVAGEWGGLIASLTRVEIPFGTRRGPRRPRPRLAAHDRGWRRVCRLCDGAHSRRRRRSSACLGLPESMRGRDDPGGVWDFSRGQSTRDWITCIGRSPSTLHCVGSSEARVRSPSRYRLDGCTLHGWAPAQQVCAPNDGRSGVQDCDEARCCGEGADHVPSEPRRLERLPGAAVGECIVERQVDGEGDDKR